ncbi:unnamed protein product [Anisakis simplex]|uniref:Uncharacterized protein n=1 Tax=Anisakis simplex TaxID=6269 RepID=A0A0M3JJQ3_ANISI|nr:unnamed protein product [Anisakis simplex]
MQFATASGISGREPGSNFVTGRLSIFEHFPFKPLQNSVPYLAAHVAIAFPETQHSKLSAVIMKSIVRRCQSIWTTMTVPEDMHLPTTGGIFRVPLLSVGIPNINRQTASNVVQYSSPFLDLHSCKAISENKSSSELAATSFFGVCIGNLRVLFYRLNNSHALVR